MHEIGIACITIAVMLELLSYWKQIAKTRRERNSKHVSSSAYILKVAKYLFTLVGLAIYSNWVGFGLEAAALIFCSMALWIIVKHKPKKWRLF